MFSSTAMLAGGEKQEAYKVLLLR
ncbi:uncharacterized protein METZ01_LOCUS227161 [marine metagenome]|uniref:Uncharacterized protein n=1 Tax=marine metagenome TaxID=408172 RepID=A0A382GI54_9ZZZZ